MSTLSIVAIIYVNNCIHMGFIAFWNLLINFCSVPMGLSETFGDSIVDMVTDL